MNSTQEEGKAFASSWSKDFHVSPFNSRKGTYSLKALNPFARARQPNAQISNTIILLSSKNHPKLIARIFSNGPNIDPVGIGFWEKAYFIFSWCLIGFLTYPRIVYEATKLFFGRKLHVWYRPEVASTSIGRQATIHEKWVIHEVQDLFEADNIKDRSFAFPRMVPRPCQAFALPSVCTVRLSYIWTAQRPSS